jgi:hypothetical protein
MMKREKVEYKNAQVHRSARGAGSKYWEIEDLMVWL